MSALCCLCCWLFWSGSCNFLKKGGFEIIYQLQLQVDALTEQNQHLQSALVDKRLRISNTGNLAEAALEINNCFRSAQNAADQYINEIKMMHENTAAECEQILKQAKAEAASIIANAKRKREEYDSAIEVILTEYGKNRPSDG